MKFFEYFLLLLIILSTPIMVFSQTYEAEVLNYQTQITLTDKKLTKTENVEIRINQRNGDRYAQISIPYSKITEITNFEAYIKDAWGNTVRQMKPADITDASSLDEISFYEDNMEKRVSLKHNTYPYTICYSYTTVQKSFINIDFWTPVLFTQIPTLRATFSFTASRYYPTFCREKDLKLEKTFIGDSYIYTCSSNYLSIIKNEEYSAAITNFIPYLIVVPKNFDYEIEGSYTSWLSFGNWLYDLMKDINTLPIQETSTISQLIGIEENEVEKVRILYHYLQDATRYINISIETGGLKPYPAQYVAYNKYGDCKALSNYFVALLNAVGIKSYYAVVYAGSPNKEIITDFPTASQFNHAIVYVPLKEDTLWLDCTSKAAFNYLGTFTQNRLAFIVEKNNSRFLRTPRITPNEVAEERKIIISPQSTDFAKVNFLNRYKGEMYENLVYLKKNADANDLLPIIQEHFVSSGFNLLSYHIFSPNRDSTFYNLALETETQNVYRYYGNDLLVSNIPFTLPTFETPENRSLPLQFDFPIFKTDSLLYKFPSNYSLNKTPENLSFASDYGYYNLNFIPRGNNLLVVKNVCFYSGTYAIEEYELFYNFYKKVKEAEQEIFITLLKKLE